MKDFLQANSKWARLARTIFQGVIGVLIANIDLLIGFFVIPPDMKPFITALVMAILSPIMATLGEAQAQS